MSACRVPECNAVSDAPDELGEHRRVSEESGHGQLVTDGAGDILEIAKVQWPVGSQT